MERFERVWLLVNAASGSNTPAALEAVQTSLADHGITLARTISFPDEPLPIPSDLDKAGISLLVVYTGDGTLNSALTELRGWDGAVLVLPGGTKNLLCKRLHGEFPAPEIVRVVAAGGARRRRVTIISSACGEAYAGLLAGPGTHWGNVREAMREGDIAGIATGTAEALTKSTSETLVCAISPPLGSREGYPLIDMTPGEHGIQINGYSASTPGEIAQQGWALLRREFREGPHDRLGIVDEVTIENIDGSPVEVLLDGESCDGGSRVTFRVALSEVHLLATHHG